MTLYEQHCLTETSPQLLSEEQLNQYLDEISQWDLSENKTSISRAFKFKDYHQTLLFINAVATIVNQENHHPNITFGYNNCSISFSTHSAAGITLFDLICAAHIDQLMSKQEFTV